VKIRNTIFRRRKGWEIDNEALSLVMLQGGGHIASVVLNGKRRVNPMWVPIWRTIEPWQYRAAHARRYGIKLLGSICGHNLCLGWFGDPSDEEASAGMETHGEAPVARWRLLKKNVGKNTASLTCGCELPVARMAFRRRLSTRRGSHIVRVNEEIRNTSRQDLPFTVCQHVTLGPPFLEKGVTVFDMPATKCHTFPDVFGPKQRLEPDMAFEWPKGPGTNGRKVDMRTIGKEYRRSSDFSAHLMDTRRDDAWFSAVNPRLGVLLAYVWRRRDFPWLGNWEENFARKEKPWDGKSLTRGMEFTNSPFPVGLRSAVSRGRFHRQPTYRWLPARGRMCMEYSILMQPVPEGVKGVADIRASRRGYTVDFVPGK